MTLHYGLIQTLAHEFNVETLCAVLGVSRTAYYRYRRGQSYQPTAEKQDKKQLVEQIFREHKRRYGSRRIVAELQEKGHSLGRQQVRSLMKLADLQSIQPSHLCHAPLTARTVKGIGRICFWVNPHPLPRI